MSTLGIPTMISLPIRRTSLDGFLPRFSFPLQKAVEMAEKLGTIVNNLDLRDRSYLSMRFQKIKIEAAIKDAVDKTRDLLTKEGVSQDTIFPTARDLLIGYGIGNPLDEKKWATISKALLKDCYSGPIEVGQWERNYSSRMSGMWRSYAQRHSLAAKF